MSVTAALELDLTPFAPHTGETYIDADRDHTARRRIFLAVGSAPDGAHLIVRVTHRQVPELLLDGIDLSRFRVSVWSDDAGALAAWTRYLSGGA